MVYVNESQEPQESQALKMKAQHWTPADWIRCLQSQEPQVAQLSYLERVAQMRHPV